MQTTELPEQELWLFQFSNKITLKNIGLFPLIKKFLT